METCGTVPQSSGSMAAEAVGVMALSSQKLSPSTDLNFMSGYICGEIASSFTQNQKPGGGKPQETEQQHRETLTWEGGVEPNPASIDWKRRVSEEAGLRSLPIARRSPRKLKSLHCLEAGIGNSLEVRAGTTSQTLPTVQLTPGFHRKPSCGEVFTLTCESLPHCSLVAFHTWRALREGTSKQTNKQQQNQDI